MLLYALLVLPPFLLGLYAQYRVKSTFAQMSQMPTRVSGAQAARMMLDSAGLHSVGIEPIGGQLSDHYDPRAKVLRLSPDVHNGRSLAALGVACHEAGHAFQDAQGYAPLVVRNLAVPMAQFGSGIGMTLLFLGMIMAMKPLLWLGILLFAGVVFFQVINLPVEFNASSRAKHQLVAQGLIAERDAVYVSKVLNAAALTYVAATLQSIMTLVYYVLLASQDRR